MTRWTVDEATLARLPDRDGLIEVCDESGRVIGYFHPRTSTEPPPDEEPAAPPAAPLAELVEQLGRL